MDTAILQTTNLFYFILQNPIALCVLLKILSRCSELEKNDEIWNFINMQVATLNDKMIILFLQCSSTDYSED